MKQYEKALEYQKKSIRILKENIDSNHPDLAISYNNIALIYLGMKQYENALEYQKKSIRIQETTLDPMHPSLGIGYWNTAATYQEMKEFEKAITLQEKCMVIFNTALPVEHPYQQQAFSSWLNTYNLKAANAFEKKDYSTTLQCLEHFE